MSFTVLAGLPFSETFISRGSAEASIASRNSDHLPSSPAFADLARPANSTSTAAPGSAVPQTFTGSWRWNTAPSEKSSGSLISARRIPAPKAAHTAKNNIANFFMAAILPMFHYSLLNPNAGKPSEV